MKKKKTKSKLLASGLVSYLTETGQTELLTEVTQELHNLSEESKKANMISVSSFIPLSSLQKENLKITLENFIDKDLPLMVQVDKKLLGGFTIRVGDWFLDASLLHQLKNIEKLLLS